MYTDSAGVIEVCLAVAAGVSPLINDKKDVCLTYLPVPSEIFWAASANLAAARSALGPGPKELAFTSVLGKLKAIAADAACADGWTDDASVQHAEVVPPHLP